MTRDEGQRQRQGDEPQRLRHDAQGSAARAHENTLHHSDAQMRRAEERAERQGRA